MALFSNALERAMHRAARNPDLQQEAFYAALLASKVWVPEPSAVASADGNQVAALFTTRALSLRRAPPGTTARELPAAEALTALRLLGQSGGPAAVVLNPHQDLWYEFHESELDALCAGLMPGQPTLQPSAMPSGQRLALGPLTENPVAFKVALSSTLTTLLVVDRAYLTLAMHAHGHARGPVLFLGLVTDEACAEEAVEAVIAQLDPVIVDNLPEGASIEVAVLDDPKLVAACDAVGPPFYRRATSATGER